MAALVCAVLFRYDLWIYREWEGKLGARAGGGWRWLYRRRVGLETYPVEHNPGAGRVWRSRPGYRPSRVHEGGQVGTRAEAPAAPSARTSLDSRGSARSSSHPRATVTTQAFGDYLYFVDITVEYGTPEIRLSKPPRYPSTLQCTKEAATGNGNISLLFREVISFVQPRQGQLRIDIRSCNL
jgi:hypothetical protein